MRELTPAAKEQQDFIEDFDSDEDNLELGDLVGEEGEPVRTAGAVAPAQSAETSTTPELDASGKPVVKPAPLVDTSGDLQEDDEEGKSATTPRSEPARTVVEESAPVQTQTPEQVQQRYTQWRGQSEELLATHHYALTQEQIDEMDLDPAKFIPKVMSRVYLDAVTAALTQVTQHLPRLVAQINAQSVNSDKSEESFYSRWPKLKDHAPTVLRMGATYRQLNPAASVEEFINEVGAQAMVALRISPEEMGVQTQKPNGKTVTPFRPAASTPAGGAQTPAAPPNVFAQLAQEFDDEELSEE